mgnify:CR=1 FL=1
MAYLDFIDELSRGIKIVFAILLNPLFVIYRFIKDIRAKSWILLLLDCLFCLEFFFVFWIFNIIWIIRTGKVFTFGSWFGVDDPSSWAKANHIQ